MTRASLSFGLVTLTLAGSPLILSAIGSCYVEPGVCAHYHPGHLDEIGEPDPCCNSINPCCPNPMWGRKIKDSEGFEFYDLCCLYVPCPGWDPGPEIGTEPDTSNEPDASTTSELTDPELDASAVLDASTEPDAGTDAGP